MRVFALCAAAFKEATRRAAGVVPLLSPPVSRQDAEVLVGWMEWAEFVYLDLHGAPGGSCWLGDGHVAALCAGDLTTDDGRSTTRPLQGTVVFAANCHLGDRDSPMMDALLGAGARYVIAGEGPNVGPPGGRLYGAPLLGLWFRRVLSLGLEPLLALRWAKRLVRLDEVLVGGEVEAANVDAVGFRAYVRTTDSTDRDRRTT